MRRHAIDSGGGKAVRNDKCHFDGSARAFCQQLPRTVVETAAEIGPTQIGQPVGGRRAQPNGVETDLTEFGNDAIGFEFGVDGVPGACMSQLEIEVIRGCQCRAGAPQTDPRGCGAPQTRPGNLSRARPELLEQGKDGPHRRRQPV